MKEDDPICYIISRNFLLHCPQFNLKNGIRRDKNQQNDHDDNKDDN